MKLSRTELLNLKQALTDDLTERARQVKLCGTGTSDEVLAGRIGRYNGTKTLLDKVNEELNTMLAEGRNEANVTTVGDDDMFTV